MEQFLAAVRAVGGNLVHLAQIAVTVRAAPQQVDGGEIEDQPAQKGDKGERGDQFVGQNGQRDQQREQTQLGIPSAWPQSGQRHRKWIPTR